MGRKYTAGQYEEMVARARKTQILAISADIIVGFPGRKKKISCTDQRPAYPIQPSPVFTYSRGQTCGSAPGPKGQENAAKAHPAGR